MIIAVDGPTASGKGTIAKGLAAHFGLPVLDTGLLYRAVGYQTQLNHGDADNAADALAACSFPDSLLDDPALRYETTGGLASRVSIHPAVRQALFQRQVDFANQPGGAVLDGRDIGTVIAPHADAKLFVTASPEERARRRHAEMLARGVDVGFDAVLADVHARDARDTGRANAPLLRAEDAMLLDNTGMDKDAALAAAIAFVEERRKTRG
ncbi:cytidylate kinase [Sphingopyxis sp. Root214]|uniref:(d)CMP kinase n=1 Tax=unclassified Sphingopyxis TaxID=2614943 RepID=UPI000700D940|nr:MULTISPECIES: d(CMP) kinase [unclassified Sphingopyxis]KQZ76754.1 cytidylate kinase [Sphingopyxis sp. Root154]KRC09359.1 cytidylate kinase [Sphingopyxis sp. Root214]